jgi:hypothetical protein
MVVNLKTGATAMKKVQDYAHILEALRARWGSTHIAGGAVRDTILDVPIRDIDIFDYLILVLYAQAGDDGLPDEELDEKLFAIIGNDAAQQAMRTRDYLTKLIDN